MSRNDISPIHNGEMNETGEVRSEYFELRKTLSNFCERCTATVSRNMSVANYKPDASRYHLKKPHHRVMRLREEYLPFYQSDF